MLNQQAKELIQGAIELLSVAPISQSAIDNATNLIKTACESIKNEKEEDVNVNINEVPYISTYYIKPIVGIGEEVKLDFYITDYFHKEYLEDDYSETFTVTLRVEGREDKKFYNLKAGDHTISLGKFDTEGEKEFSILCTDKYGRNSHELFNFFLVKNQTSLKEYIMTEEDLISYNIKNDGDKYEKKVYVTVDKLTNSTNGTLIEQVANSTSIPSKKYTCFIGTTGYNTINGCEKYWLNTIVKYSNDYDSDAVFQESKNTREGLQKFINDKKNQGYNKVKLLPGTYRIDHCQSRNEYGGNLTLEEALYIPTEFTLDLNGATIKQNQFTGNKSVMISLDNTFNSHVINGTIEGDYFSHDYTAAENPEWVNGIHIGGNSKYSSYENLTIKDITGYGSTNGVENTQGMQYYTTPLGDIFKPGDINIETGELISSNSRTTSEFVDISSYTSYKYLYVNKYSGYQGVFGGTWNLICHFYDSNKNYIKSINSYQYRRILIPEQSKYMKITILNSETTDQLSITHFRIPTHCAFKNIKYENCRCVGAAPFAMNDFLFENCEWTLCGQDGAFCAFDAEDGWEQMQDCTFRKLNFHDNYLNDFLTCAGQNFIIEDMVSGKVSFWGRTNSYVVRNCLNLTSANLDCGQNNNKAYSKSYIRFYNNTVNNGIYIKLDPGFNWSTSVKDCTIYGVVGANSSTQAIYNRCNIGGNLYSTNDVYNYIDGGKYIDCSVSDKNSTKHNYSKNESSFYNCSIEGLLGNNLGKFNFYNCDIKNLDLLVSTGTNCYTNFYNSNLTNAYMRIDYWKYGSNILFKDCIINNQDYLIKLPTYSMKYPIQIINNTIISQSTNGLIWFYHNGSGDEFGNSNPQDTIYIENNNITLNTSPYIITGLTSTTPNNINISYINNTNTPQTLLLLNPNLSENKNINVKLP